MSTLFKCDRCEEIFTEPDLTEGKNIPIEEISEKELYYRILRGGLKDLCSSCIDELCEWMNLKKKEDTPSA